MLIIEYRVFPREGGSIIMCGRFHSWNDFNIFKRSNIGNNGKRWLDVCSLSVTYEEEIVNDKA